MDRWAQCTRRWIGALLCATLLLLASCSRSPESADTLKVQAARFAALPGLRGSTHPQLATELQQIEAARQTPQQFDVGIQGHAYAPFVTAYPALSRPAVQREVNSLWPVVSLQLSPIALQKARETLSHQAAARERFDRAIRETSPRPQLRISDSLLADDEWLDAVQTGCRIEGFAAAEMLAEQQPDAAIIPLEKMLHVSRQVAREANLNARLVAVQLRADATQVLHAIANHPAASPATLQRLQQLLVAQLSDWPSDERVWAAERAQGLLTFELARAGHFNALVTAEQHADLELKGLLSPSTPAALRDVDTDELFFLRAMQQQIAAAKLPYWQRQATIESLQTELQTRSESGEFPIIAGSLLLTNFADAHRQLAEDRSRCEAWLIALTTICELPLGAPPACSLTGQQYEVQVDQLRVLIAGLTLKTGETIEVRRPGIVQA
nr:hypothetical protein [Tabrizicola sp.]